jgi:hypothetical protein
MTEEILNLQLQVFVKAFEIFVLECDMYELQEEIVNLKIVELCKTGK